MGATVEHFHLKVHAIKTPVEAQQRFEAGPGKAATFEKLIFGTDFFAVKLCFRLYPPDPLN